MQRVPNAAFDPALKKRLEDLWGQPVNLYKALANHPAFVGAWTEFAQSMRVDTKTPRGLRELMILRSGQVQESEYEWAQHLRMARKKMYFSSAKAIAELGYAPRPAQAAIADAVAWFRANGMVPA